MAGCWREAFEVAGVAIDVQQTTVTSFEGILADVLDRASSSLPRQQLLATLRSAVLAVWDIRSFNRVQGRN
jgi:hypothetical protein